MSSGHPNPPPLLKFVLNHEPPKKNQGIHGRGGGGGWKKPSHSVANIAMVGGTEGVKDEILLMASKELLKLPTWTRGDFSR